MMEERLYDNLVMTLEERLSHEINLLEELIETMPKKVQDKFFVRTSQAKDLKYEKLAGLYSMRKSLREIMREPERG